MSFIVEDGTGLVNANSYASVEYIDNYFLERSNALWVGATAVKQAAAIKGTDYLEIVYGQVFKGSPSTTTQALSFPRDTSVGVPMVVKKATAEAAILALSIDLLPSYIANDVGYGTKRTYSRADIVSEEVEYDPRIRSRNDYPIIAKLLQTVLIYSSQGSVIR